MMSDGEMNLENIVCPQFYLTSPYIGLKLNPYWAPRSSFLSSMVSDSSQNLGRAFFFVVSFITVGKVISHSHFVCEHETTLLAKGSIVMMDIF